MAVRGLPRAKTLENDGPKPQAVTIKMETLRVCHEQRMYLLGELSMRARKTQKLTGSPYFRRSSPK